MTGTGIWPPPPVAAHDHPRFTAIHCRNGVPEFKAGQIPQVEPELTEVDMLQPTKVLLSCSWAVVRPLPPPGLADWEELTVSQ
jgi:hypothetical protein